jgi:peptidoglycan hydrolase-like protein with peptidoglycan-binding domain
MHSQEQAPAPQQAAPADYTEQQATTSDVASETAAAQAQADALVGQAFGAVGDAAAGQGAEVGGAHPTLRWGSRGDDVRACQRKLNLRGAPLIEDGVFGANTHRAVISFQSERGLGADGIVGPITWGALDEGLQAQTSETDANPIELSIDEAGPAADAEAGSHQALVGAQSGEAMLDEAGLMGAYLSADTGEFQPYVSSGVLSSTLASILALMRDLGGDTQYGYARAKDGLSDGSLLGIVFNRERDALLSSRLSATDPDRRDFQTLRATSTGAVFQMNQTGTRGLMLVGDGHSGSTRRLILDLSHELTHFENHAVSQATAADDSRDIADGVATLTPAQMGETRRIYVDETSARHTEWWGAWTVRMARLGGTLSAVDPPEPQALFTACLELALDFASDPIYDPFDFWGTLMLRGDDSIERQITGWLPFVAQQSFSDNPYRNMQSSAAFLAATAFTTRAAEGDGLGSEI